MNGTTKHALTLLTALLLAAPAALSAADGPSTAAKPNFVIFIRRRSHVA